MKVLERAICSTNKAKSGCRYIIIPKRIADAMDFETTKDKIEATLIEEKGVKTIKVVRFRA